MKVIKTDKGWNEVRLGLYSKEAVALLSRLFDCCDTRKPTYIRLNDYFREAWDSVGPDICFSEDGEIYLQMTDGFAKGLLTKRMETAEDLANRLFGYMLLRGAESLPASYSKKLLALRKLLFGGTPENQLERRLCGSPLNPFEQAAMKKLQTRFDEKAKEYLEQTLIYDEDAVNELRELKMKMRRLCMDRVIEQ